MVQLPDAVSRRTRHERGQQARAAQTLRTLSASSWIESEWPDQRLNIDAVGWRKKKKDAYQQTVYGISLPWVAWRVTFRNSPLLMANYSI